MRTRRVSAVPRIVVLSSLLFAAAAGADVVSTFDDGTLQGWTKVEPFNGNLVPLASGGASGGCIRIEDTMAGGGDLFVTAPAAYTGNLTAFAGLRWQEYLYPCMPLYPSFPALVGTDGTTYYPRERGVTGQGAWRGHWVAFEESDWELVSGTSDFLSVLANVERLDINGDCNRNCVYEVMLDSIALISIVAPPLPPDPARCVVPSPLLCPAGDLPFTVILRDAAGIPCAGIDVLVSFAACDSVVLCRPDGTEPYRFERGRFTVSATSDAGGAATFAIRGGGVSYRAAAAISAAGIPLGFRPVASTDQDGDLDVWVEDLGIFQDKYQTSPDDPTIDLDGDGWASIGDYALMLNHLEAAGHHDPCAPARYLLTTSSAGPGSVLRSPDRALYDYGEVVTLTAVPDAGEYFHRWMGDLTGRQNPDSIAMTGDRTVTATFCEAEVAISTVVHGNGVLHRDPDQQCYPPGTLVTITAEPAPGSYLLFWGGDVQATGNPLVVNADRDLAIEAWFGEPDPAMSVVPPLRYCPGGDLGSTIIVRDRELGYPIAGARVTLTFDRCDSTHLCLRTPGDPWIVEPWGRYAVAQYTDSLGGCTWMLRAGGMCHDRHLLVLVDGAPFDSVLGVSPDVDGNLAVDDVDTYRYQLMSLRCASGLPCDMCFDLNGTRTVNAADVAACTTHKNAGHACASALDAGPRAIPSGFALQVPRPNPAKGATLLSFQVPGGEPVSLWIADIAGRVVRSGLRSAPLAAGAHEWTWDARDEAGRRVRPGLYFARLVGAGKVATRSLIVLE